VVAECGENRMLGEGGGKAREGLPIHILAFSNHVNVSIKSEPSTLVVSRTG
jgi:hypothetical protein